MQWESQFTESLGSTALLACERAVKLSWLEAAPRYCP